MHIRLFKPSIGEEELNAVREVFDDAWLGIGPRVKAFEEAWTEYLGSSASIALNSCTAALHMALAAFRFPEGKKVLVPSLTFASTALAALHNRLEPVFVDCDPETLSISVADLERKITPDCVAVVPVHFGGYPADLVAILDLAKRYQLKVIEDCAHCAGGALEGRKLGTWGDFGCFSFDEKKLMTTGEGGMASSHDRQLIETIRPMRWYGTSRDTARRAGGYTDVNVARHWHYEITEIGYKFNMNDLAASIGLVQLKKLDRLNRRRLVLIGRYLDGLRTIRSLRPLLPYQQSDGNAYFLFGVRTDRRDKLIRHLKEWGIATGVHYVPLTLQPLFAAHAGTAPVAEALWTQMVSLPLFADLSESEVDYVIEALHDFERRPVTVFDRAVPTG